MLSVLQHTTSPHGVTDIHKNASTQSLITPSPLSRAKSIMSRHSLQSVTGKHPSFPFYVCSGANEKNSFGGKYVARYLAQESAYLQAVRFLDAYVKGL